MNINKRFPCKYTAEELTALAQNKHFDQILVVVKDLDAKIKSLETIYHLDKWTQKGVWSEAYQGRCASAWMREIELKLVEPGDADTPWKAFADKYTENICCVREVVAAEKWEENIERITGIAGGEPLIFEDETGTTAVFDFIGKFGGYYAIHKDSADRVFPAAEEVNDRKLIQINVTTTDVDETIALLAELVQCGPFSIGTLNNQTVANAALLVDGKMETPEFHFQLGITLAGNLEFEVIQPITGPTCYKKSIDKRGTGYHHIKEIVPPKKMQQTSDDYVANGMPLVIKGTVDITSFAYINSEDTFGFYVEYGDGLPPNALPDGYNEYLYPDK